jgi:hypothetical protein
MDFTADEDRGLSALKNTQVRHERGMGVRLFQILSDSHNFTSPSVICCYSKVGAGLVDVAEC